MTRISVSIATYNRANLLDECLSHLERQRFEAGDEIVVVDNGSTDSTAAVIERHQRTMPVPLRRLEERRPGKSHALARAIAHASGDVLAFTDDDVNVDAGWLDAIRSAFADREIALAGGPVAPRWERPAPRWLRLQPDTYGRLASPLALLDYGARPCRLGSRTLLGANLAVRRDVLERVGGFATHLGKLRGTLLSGEDHELCRRIQDAGYLAQYCPDARVAHWVPASRMRLRYFISWFFWSGVTHAALDDSTSLPRYLVRRFAAGLIGAPFAWLTGRLGAAVERAIDAAFAAGYAARAWGLVRLADAPPRPSAREAAA